MEKSDGKIICLEILRPMKSARAVAWTKQSNSNLSNAYWTVLKNKPDWFATVIKEQLRGKFEWRPEPAQLEEWYNEITSANQATAIEAYLFVVRQREIYGEYAKPSPSGVKGVYCDGPPELPDSIDFVIRCLGGWKEFCSMRELPAVERKHFMDYYNSFVMTINKREQHATIAKLLQGDTQLKLGMDNQSGGSGE